jgi:hypothetical protein
VRPERNGFPGRLHIFIEPGRRPAGLGTIHCLDLSVEKADLLGAATKM